MPPFFSVIITAYNYAHLIAETIESALNQQFTDYEIIIVNNGSTDDTAHVLSRYSNSSSGRIIVIENQENRGEGGGRNRGIFAAQGKYLAFLDADDLWYPWTLQTYYDTILKYDYPAILIATGSEFYTRETVNAISKDKLQVSAYDNFFSAAARRYIPAGTPGTVVNAEDARRIGGLSEERVIGIDQEFFLKLGDVKGVVHVTSPVTAAIRRHGGNMQRNVPMAADGMLLFIKKECRGLYPGGPAYRWERRAIISRLARTISLQSLRAQLFAQAWLIYRRTILWHLRLGRIKYLVGFPFLYLYESMRSR